jgi:hypothetical protein
MVLLNYAGSKTYEIPVFYPALSVPDKSYKKEDNELFTIISFLPNQESIKSIWFQ